MSTLTTTQHSALGDLQARGHLAPSRTAWAADGRRAYSSRTLQALVDAGHAHWDYVTTDTAPGRARAVRAVRPGAACSECRESPAKSYGMCASCLHDARRSGWDPEECPGCRDGVPADD